MSVFAPDVQMNRLGSSERRNLNIEGQIISNRTLFQQVMRVMEILGVVSAIYIAEGNLNPHFQPLLVDSHPALRLIQDNKGRTLEVIK